MSWGERSCKTDTTMCSPTQDKCNADCPMYQWDGETKPDSRSRNAIQNRKNQLAGGIGQANKIKSLPEAYGSGDVLNRSILNSVLDKIVGR